MTRIIQDIYFSSGSHLFGFPSLHPQHFTGDNPSCSGGPPIGLSWEYNPKIEALPLEDYEEARGPRRNSKQMAMPRSVREEMLLSEWGARQSDIVQVVRENLKIKNSRRRTVVNLGSPMTKVEEKMEGLKKGLKKGLGLRKSFRTQYDKWQSQAQEAAALAERLDAEAMIAEENDAAFYIAEEEAGALDEIARKNQDARYSFSSDDASGSPRRVYPVVIKEEEGEEEIAAGDGEDDSTLPSAAMSTSSALPVKTLDDSQSAGAPTSEIRHSIQARPSIEATRRSFSSRTA